MLPILKKPIQAFMQAMDVNTVAFGKNRGLKLRYNNEINLDMVLGFHEPNTFEVFDLFIKEGMTVADIGANVGYFTRFLSKKAGAKGSVHVFEPIPATFTRLLDTIALNKLNNVVAVNKAVSSEDGSVTMYLSHTHYMSSLNAGWAGQEGGTVEVPAITLDSYFESLGKYPDFIKMDIEGGGVYALKGMENTIRKNEPVLMLESHTPAEDLAIGHALSLAPYEVYRVGSSQPVKHLDKDYSDPLGISGTVIGIPLSRKSAFGSWKPESFQKHRLGQRD